MGLIGVNPGSGQPREQEGTFDKVMKGISVANSVLGTAINAGELYNHYELNQLKGQELVKKEAEIQQKNSELAINALSKFVPTDATDPQGFTLSIPGQPVGQKFKTRPEPGDDNTFAQQLAAGHYIQVTDPQRLESMKQNGIPVQTGFYKGLGTVHYVVDTDRLSKDASVALQQHQADVAKTNAEANYYQSNSQKQLAEANNLGFQNADKLREERQRGQTFQDARLATKAYNQVQEIEKNPSAFGDVALITIFNKVMDPRSTVREGEFQNAARAGSFGDNIANIYNRVLSGERLTDSQRRDLVDTSKRMYTAHLVNLAQEDQGIVNLSQKRGVNPKDVITEYDPGKIGDLLKSTDQYTKEIQALQKIKTLGSSPASAPLNPPKVGEMVDGHQFLGGNPADLNAWKKVQ